MSQPVRPGAGRVYAVDAVRGMAVLAMIVTHASDAWLRPDVHASGVGLVTGTFGGFAAPAFCVLMGITATLYLPRGGYVLRGLNLAVVGYMLNVAGWLLEWWPRDLVHLATALAVCTGTGLAYHATQTPGRGLLFVLGAVLFFAAASTLPAGDPRRDLLRSDVLHALGASLCILGFFARNPDDRSARPFVAALVLVLIAPLLTGRVHAVLPGPVADFLAPQSLAHRYRGFPLAPFAAYALLGSGAVRLLRALERDVEDRRARLVAGCVIGTAVTLYLFPEQPFVDVHVAHYMMFYVTIIAAALLCASMLGEAHTRFVRVLGRHSLLAYCLHVELVFGSISGILHKRLGLPLWIACVSYVVLLMAGIGISVERRKQVASIARRQIASLRTRVDEPVRALPVLHAAEKRGVVATESDALG
ncbi:MAG: heparan-alpha-glucosaminide N-acetyltransferase domain-containing protein [Polyangia bacterium]